MTPIVWDIETKNLKERTKTSDLIVYHVYLTFFNLSLAWILYFYVWLQKKVKFLIWSENCSQFDIYQAFCLSLSESSQSNLSISNLIQNSVKHRLFCENSQWLAAVNFFVKHSHLICLTGFQKHIYNLLLIGWENWGCQKDWFSCNVNLLVLFNSE